MDAHRSGESGGISSSVSMSTDRTAVGNVSDARPVILAGKSGGGR